MTKKYSLALAAFAGAALFTTPAFADSAAASPGSGKTSETKPYPIKVVNPTRLPLEFVKSTVHVTLTVDEDGVPKDIETVGRINKEVAARLVAAVSQWRFSPKLVNGVPVSGRFELPIVLTAVDGA